METTEMAKLHTAEIRLNPESRTYGIYEGNKELKFDYLRSELDIRGGVEKRDTQYLINEGVVKQNEQGRQVFEATVPFEVFPKNENGSYELLQGNTRFKLLNQLIQHNENILKNLPEGQLDDPSMYLLMPFNFLILPGVFDPANPDQKGLILSRQHSTNNAVQRHSTEQIAIFGVEYLYSLLARNSELPKDQRRKKGEIREEVARAFNVPVSRTFHWETYSEFPEWLKLAVSDEVLNLDTAIEVRNASNRLINAYRSAGKSDTLVTLHNFFAQCRDQASSEAGDGAIRIVPSIVAKVENALMAEIQPKATESDEFQGDDDFGSEESEGGSSSSKDEDKYESNEDATAALETLLIDLPNLQELPLYNEDGSTVYELTELNAMIKAVQRLSDLIGKTAEIKAAQKEMKLAEKAARKAKDKEQELADQTGEKSEELAPAFT